jgi:hypothetical protein
VSLAQGYLRGDRPNRSSIEVVVTIAESAVRAGSSEAVDGAEIGDAFVPAETARRLSCDAGVVEVVENANGEVVSVGRKRRTFTGSLKRALLKRDRSCTFLGVATSCSWKAIIFGTGQTAVTRVWRMPVSSAVIITALSMSMGTPSSWVRIIGHAFAIHEGTWCLRSQNAQCRRVWDGRAFAPPTTRSGSMPRRSPVSGMEVR